MTAHTLPDDPNYCFCPAYDIEDEVQQIRIVFEGMEGYVPTALVALTLKCCAQHLSFMWRWQVCCGGLDFSVLTETWPESPQHTFLRSQRL